MRRSAVAGNRTGTESNSLPCAAAGGSRLLLSLPLSSDKLIADRPQDLLIGERREIDQMLAVFVSVEDDDEAIDPKRHRPSQKLVLGREVVFAEVGDGVEKAAVLDEELPVRVEDLGRSGLVCRRNDEAFDDVASDVERRFTRIA